MEKKEESKFINDKIQKNDRIKSCSFRIDDILLNTKDFNNNDRKINNSANKIPILEIPSVFPNISLLTNRAEFLPLFYHGIVAFIISLKNYLLNNLF
jgi:hypothetical protein